MFNTINNKISKEKKTTTTKLEKKNKCKRKCENKLKFLATKLVGCSI